MTVEKAVDRFLEEFDSLAYSYFMITENCNGYKSSNSITLNLSIFEKELGLELILRLKAVLGSWVSKVHIYIRTSESSSYIDYLENKVENTVILIIVQENFMKSINEESKETISVLNFLNDNINLVHEYIDRAHELHEPISFSGMLRITVDGTTKEGINLRSRKVERSRITQFIEEVANGYKREKA